MIVLKLAAGLLVCTDLTVRFVGALVGLKPLSFCTGVPAEFSDFTRFSHHYPAKPDQTGPFGSIRWKLPSSALGVHQICTSSRNKWRYFGRNRSVRCCGSAPICYCFCWEMMVRLEGETSNSLFDTLEDWNHYLKAEKIELLKRDCPQRMPTRRGPSL